MAIVQLVQTVSGLLTCAAAWGQVPVDPAKVDTEQLIRQQERERALREQSEAEPSVHLKAPPAKAEGRYPVDEQPCFPIRRIVLKNSSEFAWALSAASPPDDPAEGRCLGSQGVNLAMKRIQNAIVARGFVTTRVVAAPQDLKTGTLELTIVPGRIRQTRLTEDSGSRTNLRNALPAASGDLLNLRDIEQALENLKRVPTADADIQIAPAEGAQAQPTPGAI